MKKQDLITYLNEYLKINNFKDSSKNGLQVDNSKKEIKKIGYSVDASTYIFEKAKEEKVDLVLCHHGMYWWFEEILVWVPYERAQKLINNDIALYACHLPLDAHEEVGNNIGLLKGFLNIFWLSSSPTIPANIWIYENYTIEKFWEYKWNTIWFWLRFDNKIHISSLQTLFADTLQLQKKLYNFWNLDFINSIAFVSWAWWTDIIKQSFDKNYDLFFTWEVKHTDLVLVKELGHSIMIWWHYETEKIWPKLLAYHLRDKFDLEIVFLDEKY